MYTSADFDFANTGNDHITFSTGGLTLTPGATYVAFLSVSELYGQSSGEAFISQGDPTIPGGNFVYYNNGGDFAALFNNTWDATGLKPDWAFNATFTAGGGGGITQTAAVSRKHHGNAGDFDISLPGVECRQGNGGTFLQTIVFTFSEDVTSISGASTTTCGRVLSTTFSGNTVTVQLGNVNCDGSDITVDVAGVNGASSSVDASATMTLRVGDVNADGSVSRADLDEIRMHIGRGLVDDSDFRDDITVDGHVNHGDITLLKTKR